MPRKVKKASYPIAKRGKVMRAFDKKAQKAGGRMGRGRY